MMSHHDAHPFYIVREADRDAEVACAGTLEDAEYALRYLIGSGEETGPLLLFGPDIEVPTRAWAGNAGEGRVTLMRTVVRRPAQARSAVWHSSTSETYYFDVDGVTGEPARPHTFTPTPDPARDPGDWDAYDPSDPKHPGWRSTMEG